MDTAQWPQGIGLVKPMGELVSFSTTPTTSNSGNINTGPQLMARRAKPQKDKALCCPRCNSSNTKFCYYNNYSLTQPRYFCKACRRYWTQGGTLRNVPVGGGSRKNKRVLPSCTSSSAISSTVSTSMKGPSDHDQLINPLPPIPLSSSQNLAFPSQTAPGFGAFSSIETCSNSGASMELFKNGVIGRGPNPFTPMPMPMTVHPFGFGLQDFRHSSMSLPMNGRKVLFPFEDFSKISSVPADVGQQNGARGGDPAGLWSGVIGDQHGEGSW